MDRIEAARRVFEVYRAEHDKRFGEPPGAWWAMEVPVENAEDLGLSPADLTAAFAVLVQKELLTRYAGLKYKLTKLGKEVCLHPETLGARLGPRLPAQGEPSVTINAEQAHTQIGGTGNTMNVTYSQVLQQLEREIEKSDAPAEEKSTVLAAIKTVLAHPLTQTAISAGAGIAGAVLNK